MIDTNALMRLIRKLHHVELKIKLQMCNNPLRDHQGRTTIPSKNLTDPVIAPNPLIIHA
ncbi:MAG: hypothetical protein PHC99_09560 [Methylococcales bacterium]|nr:hypothetical protein [Methylococcales bacterium]